METTLSIEHSNKLFECGIDIINASVPYTYDAPYRTSGVGVGYVFSVGDLIAMLPETIKIGEDNTCEFNIKLHDKIWCVCYLNEANIVWLETKATNLPDALYFMIIKLIENKLLSFDKVEYTVSSATTL